jgi:D-amino-acid dehydrogenase
MAAIPRYEANTIASTRLAIAAREHLFGWAREEGIDFDERHEGILHIYRDKAGFDHAAKVTSLLAQGGLHRRAVTPQEMRAIEPTLEGQFYGGFFTESDSTGDIHKYTVGLAQAAEARGAQMMCGAEVRGLDANEHGTRVVYAQDGAEREKRFDALVVCAGTASREFAAMLGDRINVYPVKGYSITVMLEDGQSRAAAPTVSLVDDATKLVSSRLGDNRFRVAGTAEFNGFNRDIRADRIAPLVNWVQQCFPGVCTRQVVPWAGLRPMMPDLMPRVGAGKRPGVFYNTGHGHLGWTMSAATAELIAGLVQRDRALLAA